MLSSSNNQEFKSCCWQIVSDVLPVKLHLQLEWHQGLNETGDYFTGSVETTRTQEEERQKLWLSKVKENHCGVTISTCTCIQCLDKKIIVYSKYECYMFNELDIFYCCNSLPEGLGKFSFSWNSKNINNIILQFNVYSLIDCLNIGFLCSVIQLMVI